jgi:hypothetical protein
VPGYDLESFVRYEHGKRARYVSGCRCEPCREANRMYAKAREIRMHELAAQVVTSGPPIASTMIRKGRAENILRCPGVNGAPCARGGLWLRAGLPVCARCLELATVWNGMIDARPAREHIAKLRRAGVGIAQIADAAGVATITITRIAARDDSARVATVRAIMAVTVEAKADGALVSSVRSREIVRLLKRMGMRQRQLAAELGCSSTGMQVARTKRVLVSTERRLERILALVKAGRIEIRRAYVPAREELSWLRAMVAAGASVAWLEERLGFVIKDSSKSQLRPAKRDVVRALMLEVEAMTLRERRAAWPRYRGMRAEVPDAAE